MNPIRSMHPGAPPKAISRWSCRLGAAALCVLLAATPLAHGASDKALHRVPGRHAVQPFASAELLDPPDARFLLVRTGFSANPGDVSSLTGLTREQAVDTLIAGSRSQAVTPPPAWVDEPVPPLAIRRAWTVDERQAEQRERASRYDALRGWWVGEMLVTRSPLTERMTLFWHDHFPSGQDKVSYPQLMYRQNVLLRADALGNYADLLHAIAKDPAMLQYLDGEANRKGRPNENFAREVMELFTLGEGHYSQRDVTEAARAYTGWTLDPDTQAFQFNPKVHDDGVKTLLGQTGNFDGDQALDILLAQPETATFITTELWREFISETPDPVQVARIADRFRASHYDIRTALRALFLSDAFWDEQNRGVLIKSPVEFVVGTAREFDLAIPDQEPVHLAGYLRNFGENLFYPPNVKGWPGSENWINSSTLLARKQFIEQMFRSTDSRDMKMSGTPRDVAKMAMSAATPALQRPRGGIRFDLDAWLAQYGTTPQVRPGLSTELQMQHALLAVSPVDAIDAGATSSAYLRALLMDPAYQLK